MFLLVYLESVDVNGDEYQNIEIPIDTTYNSAEISTINIDTNKVSSSILITKSCSYLNNLFSEIRTLVSIFHVLIQ